MKDYTNLKFNKWTMLARVEVRRYGRTRIQMWRCQCDCGEVKVVQAGSVARGKSKGCSRCGLGNPILGYNELYSTWQGMKGRCYNKRHSDYGYYGARGIRVCDEWKEDFNKFAEYVGKRPEGMSLDRIDNSGHYEPGNVRWATPAEQAWNRRKYGSVGKVAQEA